MIVRWVLFFTIFGTITLYVLVGYLHAKRRLRKGLRPLAYHRVRFELISAPPPISFPPRREKKEKRTSSCFRALIRRPKVPG